MAAVLFASPVRAEDHRSSARLVYTRSPSAASCPDETTLRNSVATRLGYDPFVSADPRTVRAHVERASSGELRALVEIQGPAGAGGGRRELTSRGEDCEELFQAMTLTICIATDPASLTRATPSPEGQNTRAKPSPDPAPLPEPARHIDADKAPPLSIPKTDAFEVAVLAGGLASLGALPAAGPAVALGARARRGVFSLGLEARFDAPQDISGPQGGTGSEQLVAGALAPCAHRGLFFGCGVLWLGERHGEGHGLDVTRSTTTIYAAVGARAGVEIPLGRVFFIRWLVEGDVPLTVTELQLNRLQVWRSPAFNGAMGLGLGATFR